uniref:Uncharacterized protein n=1 Tax=Fagus sylvatica TaxID=28930 RepID=A0A2N9F4D8_FAGSY
MAPKKSVSEGPRRKRLKGMKLHQQTTLSVLPNICLYPRSSSHKGSTLYYKQLDAIRKVKLDLAFYIAWHMDTCVKKKNGVLSDGLHITTILNHSGVNDGTWVKKDAHVVEEMDEEAQMDEVDAQGNEEAMQEDQEPPTTPFSSSRVNEDNFQFMFGRLDSLAIAMGNLTTSLDNFSSMVTQRFSTYDENFASLAQSMEEINEHLRNHGI